jgi:signal transduction histidine kinase
VTGVVLLPDRLDFPAGIAILFAAYSAVLFSTRRWLVAALLVGVSAWQIAYGGEVTISKSLVPLYLIAPVWLAGAAMRSRELRAEASAERAERLETEREEALRNERARIARELHDVVTHSVSLMVLQTGAAREILSQDEQRSRALLASIEANGRAAIEELHRLLGLLSERDGEAPLSPQPGVGEIPSLVEQVREAGVDVELQVEGEPRSVSGGVNVAAYRVVQEALTNVVKHAGGAPVRVVLRWSDGELELEIIDEGPVNNGANRPASGRGIAGMRERAAMYGGTLDAGPRTDHGYAVHARIPLESNSR